MFEGAKRGLTEEWAACGLDLEPHFENWLRLGEPFMLTNNHPGQKPMLAMVREVLNLAGISTTSPAVLPPHHLEKFAKMPVYPALGEMFGIIGSTTFHGNIVDGKRSVMELDEFVERCYKIYDRCDRTLIGKSKIDDLQYVTFFSELAKKNRYSTSGRRNPYIGIQPYQNWKKAVERPDILDVDPVVSCGFKIGQKDKVATAGSCFAQHIARSLESTGLNYLVAEKGPTDKGYGTFSARYGNVYTTLQLDQLIDRALGRFEPEESFWMTRDGKLIDPFRPEIDFGVGAKAEHLLEDRISHLSAVRRMFEEMDYFVFTLGLTECWRSKSDGAVFPIAPGVYGGEMDWDRYEFLNLSEPETTSHLIAAIRKIRLLNPRVRIILTVSPVPLAATFEDRHVMVSTTLSKSILRVAADKAVNELSDVHYFPSYEIITGNFIRGGYFEDDFRSVKPSGVSHVMSLFMKHATTVAADEEVLRILAAENETFCAEEILAIDPSEGRS